MTHFLSFYWNENSVFDDFLNSDQTGDFPFMMTHILTRGPRISPTMQIFYIQVSYFLHFFLFQVSYLLQILRIY